MGENEDVDRVARERADAPELRAADGVLRTEDALAKSDEELRRLVVARLAEHLDIGSGLLAYCEHLACVPKGDRVAATHAASGLMRSGAMVAQAFAQTTQLERRSRKFIEHVQPVAPKNADLNSAFEVKTLEEIQNLMIRYMKFYAEETLGAAMKKDGPVGEEDGADDLMDDEDEAEEGAPAGF
jgi:hypothetical protein